MTEPTDIEDVIQRVLGAVPAAAQRRLFDVAELVELAPGTRVFAEGEPADALRIVVSGTVQLSVHQRQRDLAVASVGPGELLGWSWLVPPHRWDFDATTVDGATLVRIPAGELRSVMEDDQRAAAALATVILGVVSHRLRDTRIQLLDLFARSDTGMDA